MAVSSLTTTHLVLFWFTLMKPESSIKRKKLSVKIHQWHYGGRQTQRFERSVSSSCGMLAHFGMLGSGGERWKWPPIDLWPSNETFCRVPNNGLSSGGAPANNKPFPLHHSVPSSLWCTHWETYGGQVEGCVTVSEWVNQTKVARWILCQWRCKKNKKNLYSFVFLRQRDWEKDRRLKSL